MKVQYSGIFLKEKIKHDFGNIANLADRLQIPVERLRKGIRGERYFLKWEIDKIASALKTEAPSELELFFFLHKEMEVITHYNLYKTILKRNASVDEMSSVLDISVNDFYKKILSGGFYWNDAIIIKEKFFPDMCMDELYKRGVSA